MNTITVDRAVLEQALQALKSLFNWQVDPDRGKRCSDAIAALEIALAQEAQQEEPVAWMFDWDVYDPTNSGPDFSQSKPDDGKNWTPLYTQPPRREWQGLSEEEVKDLAGEDDIFGAIIEFARAVEQALKEKNNG